MTATAQPSAAGRMANAEWKRCAPITLGWCPPEVIADSPSSTSRKAVETTRGGLTSTTGTSTRASISLTFTAGIPSTPTFLPSIFGGDFFGGHIAAGGNRGPYTRGGQ